MSQPFEDHLRKINELITIDDKDRKPYTKAYNEIRDTLLNGMCEMDAAFAQMYKGYRLFGSYMHNVRLEKPDEFDVLFILKIAFGEKLNVLMDDKRPGLVKLRYGGNLNKPPLNLDLRLVLNQLINEKEGRRKPLKRDVLQMWISKIIKNVLEKIGNRVQSNGKCLILKYLKRGVAHTIYATDVEHPNFSISIDFVPAILIEKEIKFINKGNTYPSSWYAIPKPFNGNYLNCPGNSFQLLNPDMEHKLLLNKQHLKVVYRLLKSLRDRYRLDKLKGAFLTSMFLWEIEKRSENFWQKPISEVFLEMLEVLKIHFEARSLPYFWSSRHNLMDNLDDDEMAHYAMVLNMVFCTLETYPDQPFLTFNGCARHFQILHHF
ncbi:cyclic GMP-AMP synthase-like receptor isoform 1-T3 [Glossina fuscipes fuscipes]